MEIYNSNFKFFFLPKGTNHYNLTGHLTNPNDGQLKIITIGSNSRI